MSKFDYYTMEEDPYKEDTVKVYGWGTYPRYFVLAGQPMKQFLDWMTEEEARAKYPGIKWSNKWMEPQVSVDHLSDGPDLY